MYWSENEIKKSIKILLNFLNIFLLSIIISNRKTRNVYMSAKVILISISDYLSFLFVNLNIRYDNNQGITSGANKVCFYLHGLP